MKKYDTEKIIGKILDLPTRKSQQLIANIGEKPDAFGADLFASILSQTDDDIIKWYAIRAMGDLRSRVHSHLLIDVLTSPDREVGKSSLHKIAANSIGKIGSSLIPDLLDISKTESLETKIAVADALGEIGDEKAILTLSRFMKTKNYQLILWSSLSLAKIGEPSIRVLSNAIDYLEFQQILIVLDSLVRIGTKKTITPVAKIAKLFPEIIKHYFKKSDLSDLKSNYLNFLNRNMNNKSEEIKKCLENINTV